MTTSSYLDCNRNFDSDNGSMTNTMSSTSHIHPQGIHQNGVYIKSGMLELFQMSRKDYIERNILQQNFIRCTIGLTYFTEI